MDETAPTLTLADPTVEEIGPNYGGRKALAEKEAERAFPGRTTIVRPGLIVGAGDNSDRFSYWPIRIARGGEVLAPGNPTDPQPPPRGASTAMGQVPSRSESCRRAATNSSRWAPNGVVSLSRCTSLPARRWTRSN